MLRYRRYRLAASAIRMESREKANPMRIWSQLARGLSTCPVEVGTATAPAAPKVLRAPSPAPVSETELLKLGRATVAAMDREPRCRRRDSPLSNSARVQLARSRQTAVRLRRLSKLSRNRILSTRRKRGSSSCKVKYY